METGFARLQSDAAALPRCRHAALGREAGRPGPTRLPSVGLPRLCPRRFSSPQRQAVHSGSKPQSVLLALFWFRDRVAIGGHLARGIHGSPCASRSFAWFENRARPLLGCLAAAPRAAPPRSEAAVKREWLGRSQNDRWHHAV